MDTEQPQSEVMIDEVEQVTLETQEREEKVAVEYIPREITPTEDLGPRFVGLDTPVAQPLESDLKPKAEAHKKRHPRNVPKFSRCK